MKKYFTFIILLAFVIIGCKEDKKTVTEEAQEPERELTLLEKIAHANGYENWKNVEELKFTFNVDRDTSHFERTWIWKPKTQDVTMMSDTDTLSYNRKQMDSVAEKTNGGFINDKYWLIAPINILWDEQNITQEHTENIEAPISKQPMQKLTVVYGNEGGYTPGDAYDFYFGDDHIVKEWVFRKANQEEPSMVTSWEDYTEKGGLKIAQMHKMPEGDFKLYFTDVEVKTN
ncbi:hypothetical protein [Maribacter halichondriae]|uniref:hypothetical protein n=1 Tax=Maribacter halichondriae TaxID=2980554 RepID=UPI002358EF5C|nr:hypothetical protein [Maribacter sp. Hal144]